MFFHYLNMYNKNTLLTINYLSYIFIYLHLRIYKKQLLHFITPLYKGVRLIIFWGVQNYFEIQ